ncbi:MAG: hypothetical protein H3C62_04225 [Gemmatimonadaceae bacterium]|nr:hypothetical protein [Gemmatimonadaceae bacterium]
MWLQIASLIGSALILGAYFALQRGQLHRGHRSFHVINLVGSSLLAWAAIDARQAGLIVVEVAWALLSIPGSVRPPRP